jgi:carbamoyl-phosphate synthase large subunit
MNIFITGIGGDLAQNVVASLKNVKSVNKIIGSDISAQNSGRMFVDKLILSSAPSDNNYLTSLSRNFKEHKIEAFIPMSQLELEFFANLESTIFQTIFDNVKYIGLDKSILKIFLDKQETEIYLNKAGFTTPQTFKVEELEEKNFPVIVKPRFGSGSKGIFKCENLNEVNSALLFSKEPIIQQFIDTDDSEFTVGIFSNRIETKVISFRRKISGSGATTWARHEVHESIINLGLRIAKELNLYGSLNVQLRIKNGLLYIFEINPRFSSTVLIRSQLGFNDVAWSLGDFSTFESFDSKMESNSEFATYVRPIRIC